MEETLSLTIHSFIHSSGQPTTEREEKMKRGGRRNVERGGNFTERLVREYGNGQTERWGGAEWMRMLTHFRKNGTLEDAETCFRGIPERLKNVLHYNAALWRAGSDNGDVFSRRARLRKVSIGFSVEPS